MNKEKCIEILEDLSCYIDENWDDTDPEIAREIKENMQAIEFAVELIRDSDVVGTMKIGDENYLISKRED